MNNGRCIVLFTTSHSVELTSHLCTATSCWWCCWRFWDP